MIIKGKNIKNPENIGDKIIEVDLSEHETVETECVIDNNPVEEPKEEEIDLFNLDNIDFRQRQERRKGDRRRGFRRIDDRNLVSRAREEALSIKESAYKEGYQAGLEQAREDISELKNSLEAFSHAPQEVYEKIAPDILPISIEIAKKIIKKEVNTSHDILFSTVVEVLKELSKDEVKITLSVNPSEVDFLRQSVPEVKDLAGVDAKISVLADENISEGGCLIATTNGVADATIETRLAVISEALKEI